MSDSKKKRKGIESKPEAALAETLHHEVAASHDSSCAETVITGKLGKPSTFSTIDVNAATLIGTEPDSGPELSTRRLESAERTRAQNFELASLPELPGYRYVKIIGRGGMGVVLQARDLRLDRDVAIKLPLPQFLEDPQFRERFLREARTVAALRHPNICPIYDFGENEGQLFLVMPFIAGKMLDDWRNIQKPDARQICEMLAFIGDAVAVAHETGIIHRDLKPSNVIVEDKNNAPLLMDFGLAKQLADEQASLLTQDGQIVGTPAYMPPEQARGSSNMSLRADIYSLGAILYEMLTGRPPYSGGMRKILLELEAGPPTAPKIVNPKIHADLETICLKSMARNPQDRYSTAVELATDLRRFACGESILAQRISFQRRTYYFLSKHKIAGLIVLCLLCMLFGAGLWLNLKNDRLDQQALYQRVLFDIKESPLDSVEDRKNITALIYDLAARDERGAAEAWLVYLSQLEDMFNKNIAQARISEEMVLSLNQLLGEIKVLDAQKCSALSAKLVTRLENWQLVGTLAESLGEFPSLEKTIWTVTADGFMASPDVVDLYLPTQLSTKQAFEVKAQWKGYAKENDIGICLQNDGSPLYGVIISKKQDSVDLRVWELVLLRKGQVLMSWPIQAPSSQVSLRFRFVNGVSTIQYQEQLFSYRDIFSLDYKHVTLDVIQPSEVVLQQLQLFEKAIPSDPSQLQLGDSLSNQGQWQQAEEAYAAQILSTELDTIKQEAKYKIATCLIQLNRRDEANAIFSELIHQNGDQWGSLSACQLWASLLEMGKHREADAVASYLDVQFDRTLITAHLPHDLRKRIHSHYAKVATGKSMLIPDENRIPGLRNLIQVYEILGGHPDHIGLAYFMYERALLWEHKNAEAFDCIESFLEKYGDAESRWTSHIIADYAWHLRLSGSSARAIKIIELYQQNVGANSDNTLMLAGEYARCLIDLGRMQDAIDYLNKIDSERLRNLWYHAWADVYCVLAHVSKSESAQRTFQKQSRISSWQPQVLQQPLDLSGFSTYYAIYSIQYEDDEEVRSQVLSQILDKMTGEHGDGNSFSALTRNLSIKSETLLNMWSSKRGERLAHDFIMRVDDLRMCISKPVCLFAYTAIIERIFGSQVVDDAHDQLIWDLCSNAFEAHQNGKLDMKTILGLAMTYKGVSGPLGWGFAVNGLDNQIKGPIAYLMSVHYHNLNLRAESEEFLQQAQAFCQAGSGLDTILRARR